MLHDLDLRSTKPIPPPHHHQVIRRLVRRNSGEEKRLDIPLSLGGRASGTLSLRIGIHKREYAYELVRPEVALRTAPLHQQQLLHLQSPTAPKQQQEEAEDEEEKDEGVSHDRRRVNFEVEGVPLP